MIGSLLLRAHVVVQAITAPIRTLRQRHAIACLKAVSDAKDAYRQAKVRGDCRKQHEAGERLKIARTTQLRAELAMGGRR